MDGSSMASLNTSQVESEKLGGAVVDMSRGSGNGEDQGKEFTSDEEGWDDFGELYQKVDVHSFDLRSLNLSFKDASFEVKQRGVLLKPISGVFRGGQLVAMMGPSGSGKTTLLTMLAHKKTTPYTGEFHLNGREIDAKLFPRFTGYVPQEEHLDGDMTVREALYFYVMLKNTKMTSEEGHQRVEILLKQMQLEAAADTFIGTETRRGISGGQKRRVNIAKSFANIPPILFLDEPTSGLSSTDSMTVVQCLRNFADRLNILIVCVIHQPRHSVFQLFDLLLLLSSNGRCVYQGPVNEVVDYFAKMGRPIPAFENPPDFMLDVVTSTSLQDVEEGKDDAAHFADEYDEKVKPLIEKEISEIPKGPTLDQVFHIREKKLFQREAFSRSMNFQTKLLLSFQLKLRIRNWREIVRRLVLYVVIGVLLGAVFFRTNELMQTTFNRILAMWVVIGFAAIFTMEALPKLMADRTIYKYDRKDGIYSTLPYLTALSVTLFIENTILTIIMGSISYWMIGFSNLVGDFFTFLLFLVAVYWVTEGVMLLLASSCADAAQANGLTVAVLGVLLVFSGLVVNPGSSPAWLSWLCWISPYWYAFQSIMVILFRPPYEFPEGDLFSTADGVWEAYGVNPDLLWWNLLIVIAWAILYRAFVVGLLRYAHNPKI